MPLCRRTNQASFIRALAAVLLVVPLLGPLLAQAQDRPLERSFWLHASLGLFTQHGYFGSKYPQTQPPAEAEVRCAAALLTGKYGANRLYLIYHREMPVPAIEKVFSAWRKACPREVEVIPALVLNMYDREQTPVFTGAELARLIAFCRSAIHPTRMAIYDIAPRRASGEALAALARAYPDGLIRLGLQPDEPLPAPPFAAAVQDTWSGFCHGTDNERDWLQPGFGAETLCQWVRARNASAQPIVWNLIVVAWDYTATPRGGYPGYDDAEKNLPLPAGRNALAANMIRDTALPKAFGGFSSDLYILHENSRSAAHDGRTGSFYETLKRGEDYAGYYATPFREVTGLYQDLRTPKPTDHGTRRSSSLPLSERRRRW